MSQVHFSCGLCKNYSFLTFDENVTVADLREIHARECPANKSARLVVAEAEVKNLTETLANRNAEIKYLLVKIERAEKTLDSVKNGAERAVQNIEMQMSRGCQFFYAYQVLQTVRELRGSL
jgi:hypothetical protein